MRRRVTHVTVLAATPSDCNRDGFTVGPNGDALVFFADPWPVLGGDYGGSRQFRLDLEARRPRRRTAPDWARIWLVLACRLTMDV